MPQPRLSPGMVLLASLSLLPMALPARGNGAAATPVAAPVIFAPGVISGPAHDSAPAFTPDGNTVYFSRSNAAQSVVMVSTRHDGAWQEATVAPFSGAWNDMEPSMAPGGEYLVFVSNRPPDGDRGMPVEGYFNGATQHGGNLWRVDRSASGWSPARRLPDIINRNGSTFAPSIAADGSLYFMSTDATTGKFRLYRAAAANGVYGEPQPLPFSDGSSTDVDPAVAPDERFLVFGSGRLPKRGIDLFIVFRDAGQWGEPVSLGEVVNSPGSDAEARLSPDQRTLYFSSDRVMPVSYPRSAAQASTDAQRMQAWDNGNYNIWSVSLAPWLDAHVALH